MKMEMTLPPQTGLLSTEDLNVFRLVNMLVLTVPSCIVGIVLNVINVVVFLKQGLSNTVNISMFAISVSGLCGLVTLLWVGLNQNPLLEATNVPYITLEITYLTGAWPHACFLLITVWITVYVTAERFVCIALPLKVKQIFTPLRTKVVISLICVSMFLAVSPVYVTFSFGKIFYPPRNQTLLGLRNRYLKRNLNDLVFMLFAVMGMVSFFILVLFTYLLVVALKKRLQWRKKARADGDACQSMSRRDVGTMKMVSLVSGVLIICTAPGMILCFVVFAVPGFHFRGHLSNIAQVCWTFAFFPLALNLTINFLFFYKMSSNYKRTFQSLLPSWVARCHGGAQAQ